MTTTTYEHLFGFFGLQKNPFGASPDSRFFFSTPAHESALAELLFAIQTRQGLMLLTGEAGAGKTTLLRQLLDTLEQRGISSSYVFHSRLDADHLIRFILRDFGLSCDFYRKGETLRALHEWLVARHAAGDTPVIIIDEAQALRTDTIDELRLLLNLEEDEGKLVQIILSGQPQLNEMLRKPELRQLRQRVMFRSKLPLLTREGTSAYIRARLSAAGLADPDLFPTETVDALFLYSRGIPRTINLLGEHAILNAYAEQKHSVPPEAIRSIASDFDLVENPPSVNQDDGSDGSQRTVADPAPPSSQPRSLSALRLAFLGEEPGEKPAPAAATLPRSSAFALEELLTLSDAPPLPKGVAPGRQVEREVAPVAARTEHRLVTKEPIESPAETSSEDSAFGNSAQSVSPVAAATAAKVTPSKNHADRNAIVHYWKEVAESFRRDVSALRQDYANTTPFGKKTYRDAGTERWAKKSTPHFARFFRF